MAVATVDRSKSRNIGDNKGLSRDGGKWCPIHRTNQHDFDESHIIKNKVDDKLKDAVAEYHNKQAKPDAKDDEPEFRRADQSLAHIFEGSAAYEFKRQYKAIEREVNLALTRPTQDLKWSEVLITFNQVGHPAAVLHPSRYSIMVQPTFLNINIHRTLVDPDNSLNLIFAKLLDEMGISRLELKAGAEPFHGITPNSSNMPLGQIELLVTFEEPGNFRIEKLTFDVVNFETAYNVILGHPMLGRFMTMVHYVYQTLKISGPKRVIIVKGDQRAMLKCDK
ncbi:uncharacterized protein LOC133914757 [Phragmites australis]|uniref:uncharacterized protein LOC133914757 n=1 Tax=Phragmites australis TaxID=29695 RepID=UPI002D7874B9|nr:uncharacterized protein LOC133914757 [Phragmites australis]